MPTLHIRLLPFLLLSTAGCGERHVAIVAVNNLRSEVVKPTNEHVIDVDVVVAEADAKLIEDRDPVLEYGPCPLMHPLDYAVRSDVLPNRRNPDRAFTLAGAPAHLFTYEMFQTNQPSSIPQKLRSIGEGSFCVRLRAERYFLSPGIISRTVPLQPS